MVLVQNGLKERGDWQVAPLLTQFNLQLLLLSGTSFSLRLQRKPKLNQNLKQSYQGNKMGELGIRKHITHTLSNSEQKQSYFGTYAERKGQLAPWADAGCGLLAFVWVSAGISVCGNVQIEPGLLLANSHCAAFQ